MRDQRLLQLFLRFRAKGDLRALGKLFDAVSPELIRVARHVAYDAAEAEDLVQATFLIAMEHPERFDAARPLVAWLAGVLTKEALLWRRQAARKPDVDRVTEPLELREERGRPQASASAREFDEILTAALNRLPALYRDVLERHLCGGLSPQEIAREQAALPATVRVRLHRGMAQLRQVLPAGMASGLALLLSERGLGAVRKELVAHAKTLPAAGAATVGVSASTSLQIGSLLMLQRIGLVVIAAIVLVLSVRMIGDLGPDPGGNAGDSTALELDASLQGTGGLAPVTSEDRARTLVDSDEGPKGGENGAPQPTALFGSLRVATRFADGTLAPNVGFQYVSFGISNQTRFGQTDENGVVLLRNLTRGSYSFYMDRGGFGLGTVTFLYGPDKKSVAEGLDSTVLTLNPGTNVRGRVLDSFGRPVAGAEIWVTNGIARDRAVVVATSASDGSFVVQQLTDECFFGARGTGFVPSRPEHVQYWKERMDGSDAIEVDLELGAEGSRVSGTIVDPQGLPVAGATVRVGAQEFLDSFGSRGATGPPPPVEVLTDEAGYFSCNMVEAGKVEIACKASGYPVGVATVQVEEGREGTVAIQLQVGAWVRGRIIAGDGTPIPNLSVFSSQAELNLPTAASSFDEPRATTAVDGSYALGPLHPGSVRIHTGQWLGNRAASTHTTLVLESGAEVTWNGRMKELPTISGVALDGNGDPLIGWTVVSKSTGNRRLPARAVRTKAEGRFTLSLPASGEVRLELYAPAPPEQADRTWGASKAPRAWVEGVTTESKGVRLILSAAQEPTATLMADLETESGSGSPKFLVTAWHGTFGEVVNEEWPKGSTRLELGELPAGDLSLKIEAADFASIRRTGIALEQGDRLDLGALRFVTGGGLRVNIKRSDGSLAEKVDVELKDADGTEWYVSPNGGVVFREGLAPGVYRMRIRAQGSGPKNLEVVVRAQERTELEAVLEPGGSIGFVLMNSTGRPFLADTQLRVETEAGAVLFDELQQLGDSAVLSRWMFVPFGTLRVIATATSGERCERQFEWGPSDSTEEAMTLVLK